MWTDEQLRAQGWTDEQIAIHRSEEASTPISEAIQSEEIETITSPVNNSVDLSF